MIESLLMNLEPCIRAVAIVLIHSLWQGVVIGFVALIALTLLKYKSAAIRYAVTCGAMAIVFLITTATAVSVWTEGGSSSKHLSTATSEPVNVESSRNISATIDNPSVSNDMSSPNHWWKKPSISRYIFAFWILGVTLISIYHFVGWRRAGGFARKGTSPVPAEWQSRFKKLCDQSGVKRFVSFLGSSLVKVPCVVGWIKPVLLVPVSMFSNLEPSEIEMILIHELAHVRRYDVLVNMMQTTMETLFFFNPAIWWLSRQIRIERENCCDDAAILRSGERLRYARALTNLEELRMFQTSFGTGLTGAPLRHRIQRIAGVKRPRFYSSILSISGMLSIASVIVLALGSFGDSPNLVARASEEIEAVQGFKPEPNDLRGDWETESEGEQLRILVYGRQSSGMCYILNRGKVAHLIGQGRRSFQIDRDAGTLFLEGRLEEHGRKVEGSGEWYFRPDTAYMRYMSHYGLREDDRQKTFSLAIRDISRKYLSEMEERGYGGLTVDQLISAGVFGISPKLVDEYRLLGYPELTYQQLLSLQVQGVIPDDARRFERLGAGHLTPEQLISAKIQGITPEYVESFRKAGFRNLTFKNFGTLHAFNLDVDDFEDCYRNRFMDLSQENMVWVCGFGITREDVERMKKRGFTDIDSIIKALAKEYGQ